MRVFVTGATGFVGSALVRELIAAGHQVTGLARGEAGAAALAAAGAAVRRGTLEDLDGLRRGAADAEGVIHTAFIHDFDNYAAACVTDRAAIGALADALAGSGRPLVVTSGTALAHAAGRVATEEDAADPGGHPRAAAEGLALAAAGRGVRVAIVRLPPTVHDEGDHGFVPALIQIARHKRVSATIGDGANRWPAVHRRDAARLFRLALERAPAGSRWHGVGEEGVPARDIAAAIGRGLGVPVVSLPRGEAEAHFGWMARFFAMDNPASSERTRAALGWQATGRTLAEDLEQGDYF